MTREPALSCAVLGDLVKCGELCGRSSFRWLSDLNGWVIGEDLTAFAESAKPTVQDLFSHTGRVSSHQSGVDVQTTHHQLTKVQLQPDGFGFGLLRTTRCFDTTVSRHHPADAVRNLTGFTHCRSPTVQRTAQTR